MYLIFCAYNNLKHIKIPFVPIVFQNLFGTCLPLSDTFWYSLSWNYWQKPKQKPWIFLWLGGLWFQKLVMVLPINSFDCSIQILLEKCPMWRLFLLGVWEHFLLSMCGWGVCICSANVTIYLKYYNKIWPEVFNSLLIKLYLK